MSVFIKSRNILRKSWHILGRVHNFSTETNRPNLKINEDSLNKYIKHLQREYDGLNKSTTNISRKHYLHRIMGVLNERKSVIDNINNLKELIEDKGDLGQLAKEETNMYKNQLDDLDNQLLYSLVPSSKEDNFDSIVLEVQAGVGGQEAMLFAKEIFEMYTNFAVYKGWDLDLTDYASTELGGIRLASALIQGPGAFRYLKHEAGVHRVQRVPTTEKGGRMHTSTISVIAMPQPSEIEITINPADLRIETKRASGAGGQHVNKTESAVRIVHLPTGVAVECQVDRSQIKNRRLALAKLRALLYQRDLDQRYVELESFKKSQVRTRNRNEKIRTYNYTQDRITDHRLSLNVHNLKAFLEGGKQLDSLIQKLDEHYLNESLLNVLSDYA
ncbi:unnamed protein product [Phyllotreta striolata]|uniref:Prokaryotic-type class I peptide chain release factors domain-containing protein n=1 Tax=Phyllotreta striolata TaxID=444603 RepID=A0A9N9TED4_PHYSR|nr:unnamed protein product [Phyllotreta striolata]